MYGFKILKDRRNVKIQLMCSSFTTPIPLFTGWGQSMCSDVKEQSIELNDNECLHFN